MNPKENSTNDLMNAIIKQNKRKETFAQRRFEELQRAQNQKQQEQQPAWNWSAPNSPQQALWTVPESPEHAPPPQDGDVVVVAAAQEEIVIDQQQDPSPDMFPTQMESDESESADNAQQQALYDEADDIEIIEKPHNQTSSASWNELNEMMLLSRKWDKEEQQQQQLCSQSVLLSTQDNNDVELPLETTAPYQSDAEEEQQKNVALVVVEQQQPKRSVVVEIDWKLNDEEEEEQQDSPFTALLCKLYSPPIENNKNDDNDKAHLPELELPQKRKAEEQLTPKEGPKRTRLCLQKQKRK
jgi:hypothetical protein